jgi:tetratricopeptide (TPR) repeat protein
MRAKLLAACAVAFFVAPATAQAPGLEQQWIRCANTDSVVSHEVARDACTEIITSGRESQNNVAIASFNRANAQVNLGAPAAASADYTTAITLGVADSEVYYGRGIAHYDLQQYDNALSDYNEALRQNPNYGEAYGNRGNVYQYGRSEFDTAIADYTRALSIRENDIDLHNRGNAYQYGKQDYERALSDYARAVQLDPEDSALRIDYGNAMHARNDQAGAIAQYNEALRIQPDYATAIYNRGNSYSVMGELQRAFDDWSETARLDPNYADAWGNRADWYYDRGEYDNAIADADRALTIRVNAADSYTRGLAYQYGRNDLVGAIADFDRALAIEPNSVEYNNASCWARAMAERELDLARRQCDTAVTGSVEGNYRDSRGMIGLRQGRFQDAWDDYNAAVQTAPQTPHYLYGRGIAALRLGRTAEGQADIAAATAISAGIGETYAGYGVTP